jgi:meso-butanediol dehydrogenase/(S,S)-butanediol dehydrogenase/diacetyl reductase
MRLEDQVALITGGGSGIGQAIAERFAGEGARVIVADRIVARAEQTATKIEAAGGVAAPIFVEVADSAAVAAMSARAIQLFGRVDVLVNNAAIAEGDDILTFDESTWDRNVDIVLKGVFLCSRAIVPGMIAQGRGAIVNIASVNGLTGLGEEAYSAAKAGVINLTQNMAIKYGRYGVRANVICPGTIRTPIWAPILKKDPAVFEKLARWYPLGRVGAPEDVANAALFLASSEAAWITGAILPVDGGLMAGNFRMGQELMGEG